MKAFALLLFIACAVSASAEPSPDSQKEKAELLRIHRAMKKTIVFVTHDIEEALRLATHIAVMQDGRIVASHPRGRVMLS